MTPLAAILRPNRIEDYIGQKHLVGQGAILRSLIEAKRIPSLILWGPPGVGKTTLANIIASMMEKSFFNLSAINSGVKDIREVIQVSRKSNGSILFIDEIHRFSKSQQDSLLAAVEEGIISLIGATTENPSFEIITPLLSRCQVFILKNLEEEDLLALLEKAIAYYKTLGKEVCIEETEALFRVSGGDARKLLNAIEIIVQDSDSNLKIRNENVMRIIQKNLSTYDKNG